MISENVSSCPKCGGHLRFFDTVKRIVRTKARVTEWIMIRRLRCTVCGTLHRELPETLFPYKQYEADENAEIVAHVLESPITGKPLSVWWHVESLPVIHRLFVWIWNCRICYDKEAERHMDELIKLGWISFNADDSQ